MPKTQKIFRASPATLEKLAWLKERYGTEAEVIAIAIDKLFEEENRIVARSRRPEAPPTKTTGNA